MKLFFNLSKVVCAVFALLVGTQLSAQVLTPGVDPSVLASQIVGDGVTISNLTIDCDPIGYGVFSGAASTTVSLENGILLTTGAASDAFGPNSSGSTSVNIGNPFNGDADLQELVAFPLQDACSFSFDFEAASDMISVQYVFGSEEYEEYVCSSFNDIFAFFVNGPRPGGGNYDNDNVALIPGSGGLPVAINSLNNGEPGFYGSAGSCSSLSYSSLYVDNEPGATIEYDGLTVILTAEVAIIPGETYTFKFAIADASDSQYDSGVFIKANSFSIFNCQAGDLSADLDGTSPYSFCSNDANDDAISVSTSSTATGDEYRFILVDDSNEILAINESGDFDLNSYSNGSYFIYGISYDGALSGLELGNNLSDLEAIPGLGCFELTGALEVILEYCPVGNPDLNPEDCTLFDVILILDESGSIDDNPNGAANEQAVRDAAVLLAQGISGTGASMAVIEFSTGAIISNIPGFGAGYNEVTPAYVSALQSYLNSNYNANGWTNWEAAFDRALTLNDDQIADLILIVTDGNPTAYVSNGNCIGCDGNSGNNCVDCNESISLNQAIPKADQLKAAGSHMFALGIGASIDVANLAAITGPDQDLGPGDQPGPDPAFNQADFTLIPFSELQECLAMIADISCVPPCELEFECPNEFGGFYDCAADIPAADPGSITILDYCDEALISVHTESWGTGCGIDTLFVEYTYNIQDGNQSGSCTVLYKATDDVAPVILTQLEPITVDCGIDNLPQVNIEAEDNCSSVSVMEKETIIEFQFGDCEGFRTQTQGGWGTTASGDNPGAYRDANFASAFPGGLTIGCTNTLTLTSSSAVKDFLPSGSTASALPAGNLNNPGNSYNNVFAGQLVAATLNVGFDAYDPNFGSSSVALADLVYNGGIFEGWTVAEVIAEANQAIGGCGSDYSFSMLSDALATFNENYVDGTTDNGDLSCEGENNPCEYTLLRCWIVEDECGNYSAIGQEVTVIDDQPPVFVDQPQNLTISCGEEIPEAAECLATDNCTDNITYGFTEEYSGPFPLSECASEDASNHTLWIGQSGQVFPGVSGPNFNAAADNEFTEYADGTARISGEVIINGNPNKRVRYALWLKNKRTYEEWTSIPNASSPTGFRQEKLDAGTSITITDEYLDWSYYEYDETKPNKLIGQGDFEGLEYNISQMPADYRYGVQVGDKASLQSNGFGLSTWLFVSGTNANGNNVNVQGDFNLSISQCSTPEIEFTCESSYTLTRTWTATDECGNTASVSQTIEIGGDDEAPVIDCPPSVTVTCEESTHPDNTGMASATDNCSNVTVDYTDGPTTGDCPYSFVRTWTAMDECGNESSCEQTITIIDDVDPFVVTGVPAEVIVECDEDLPTAMPVFDDNCDEDLEILPASSISEADCGFVINRSWTATDDCDNSITVSQTIYVVDTTDPFVVTGVPAELIVECDEDLPTAMPVFDDNCDEDLEILPASSISEADCGYVINRSWTATDDCDNSITVSQTIYVVDTTDPFVVTGVPAELIVECDEDVPTAMPVFDDNCDEDLEILPISSIGEADCGYVINRSWTAIDDCENSITVSQTIYVVDTTDPFVVTGVPAELIVECDEDVPTAMPVFDDNCDEDLEILPISSIGEADCGYVINRSWTAIDDCENSITVSQTIYVVDTTDPFVVTGVPSVVTVECNEDLPTDAPTFDDNCDEDLEVVPTESVEPGDCGYVLTRTWTAIDDCENSITVTQVINVVDTTDPVLEGLPENTSITCEEELPVPPVVTANDDCQGELEVFYEQTIDDSECPVKVYRTWTANDGCENSTSYTQTILITDEVPPVFLPFPQYIQISCELVDDYMVEAEDNCSDVTITFTDVLQSGGCYGTLIRTWKATDACGNMTTANQIIGITDFIAPTIEGVGEDMTVECSDPIVAPDVNAYDNCSDVDLQFNEQIIPGSCPNNYTIVWTWTATDYCDNVTVAVKQVFVEDNTDPVFTAVPADQFIECTDPIPPVGVPSAFDNCGEPVITMVESIEEGLCPQSYTIVRTYTATDSCGNSAEVVQNIFVQDNTPPVISGVEAELTYLCTEDVPDPSGVEAIDACGPATWDFSDVIDNSECASEYDITRTFVAIDACGNSSELVQIIHVIDEEAPVLSAEPADLVIDCEAELPAPMEITATDNCDLDVMVSYTQEFTGDQPTPGSTRDCALFTPAETCNGLDSWAVRLFNAAGLSDFNSVEAYWVEFPDGTAHLSGHVVSIDNENAGLDIDVYFENGVDWEEWQDQPFPTNYKDDCDNAGDNYLDWTYYIMTAGQATLTGTGDLEGTQFSLTHIPANLYYAFQVGVNANNLSFGEGIGGWFAGSGPLVVDGVEQGNISFTGDFAFDMDCCPRYEVVRTWTATDCAGNTTSWSQTISFAEIVSSPTPNFADNSCREDINGDGLINTADIIGLLAEFGCTENCSVDIDGNGATNTGDLLIVLSKLGTSCE